MRFFISDTASAEASSGTVHRIRMKEAKRLLTMTNEPIARVGELSGYPDQFYFSRTFRKEVGENPTKYRKMNYLSVKSN